MTTTIKVPDELRNRLAQRAQERHVSQADVIAEALEALERREFWAAVDAGYERLRQDPEAWSDYVNERDEWVSARLVDAQE
ncbi:putative transcriptional regulator [Saccharopolyspora lacisalsi]|uniref:Putative transcriptional regulator n=1 Tax=Halosaccharopolyspora lacisalsi TaxID=1000566 RepID=A0A839DYU5_9PSEU|nr:CopG family transcriptional regulator [Halosaccharopolyspora lacisalsi]MBA8825396.1 putative transcriptional regulator [Halosaccharopolyspora lacisalsi]